MQITRLLARPDILVFSGAVAWLLFGLLGSKAAAETAYSPRSVETFDESWRWREYPQVKGKGLNCLERGPSGAMWFGVDGGALRYDGINWTQFGKKQGLPASAVDFASTGDQLYASTRSAIYAFHNQHWTEVFPGTADRVWVIEDLLAASDGSLWAATSWGALRIVNPQSERSQTLTLYATAAVANAFKRQPHARFDTIPVDTPAQHPWPNGSGAYLYGPIPNGQLVIALADQGPAANAGLKIGDQIVGIDGEDRLTIFQNELDAQPGSRIDLTVKRPGMDGLLNLQLTTTDDISGDCETFRPYALAEGPDSTLWFATRLGQIISLTTSDKDSRKWMNHTQVHNLPSVAVPSITATTDGVAAVGRSTNTKALLQFTGSEWITTELSRGINSSIVSLQDRRLLIGVNGGYITISPRGKQRFRTTKDLGIFGNDILVKQTSDKAIWIAGKGATVIRVEPQGGVWTSYDGIVYQDTGADGAEWFISDRQTVVRRDGDIWRESDTRDGLMTIPMSVVATKSGDVWAAGSHKGIAATARLKNGTWTLKQHPKLSWTIDRRAAFEDRDGRMWFGAATVSQGQEGMLGGVVRFDGSEWKHIVPTNRLTYVYGICQTGDGSMWFGGPALVQIQPDDQFGSLSDVPGKAHGYCDSLAADNEGNLWVVTRNYGILKMNGHSPQTSNPIWFNETKGLSNDRIRNVLPLADGTVLANTFAGIDRYDGKGWSPSALDTNTALEIKYDSLRQSPDNAVWANSSTLSFIDPEMARTGKIRIRSDRTFGTCRYLPDNRAPETQLVSEFSELPVGDDVLLSWSGSDAWNETPISQLTYSWRLDDEPWSPFSLATLARIPNLPSGSHRLEVRARDRDFNVDASPAAIRFHVIPALWDRTWFRTLMLFTMTMLVLAVIQTARVFRREASLRISNEKLLNAEQQLLQANTALEQRVIQRTHDLNVTNQKLVGEIEERTAAESRLRESEVRYRSIVEDQTEYIVRFNSNSEIEFINDAFLRGNGLPPDSNAKPVSDLLPAEVRERVKLSIGGLNAEAATKTKTIRIKRPDGSIEWEEWHGRALFNDQQLIGYQAIGRNITDLKAAQSRLDEKEQQLAHIARVSALGEMVAGISHEISQPLASICNYSSASQLLLDQQNDLTESRDNLREWCDRIGQQAKRISGIIKSLRRFGRPGSEPGTFQIGDAVEESLLLTETRTRTAVDELTTDCPAFLPAVTADRVQIEQVLVNLIRNACDAMEMVPTGQRRLRIEAEESEGAVVVTITDSGPGIAAENYETVFDTFVTTKADGMGIGLAISRSIIESHNGELTAMKDAGCGKFRFSLPVTQHAMSD